MHRYDVPVAATRSDQTPSSQTPAILFVGNQGSTWPRSVSAPCVESSTDVPTDEISRKERIADHGAPLPSPLSPSPLFSPSRLRVGRVFRRQEGTCLVHVREVADAEMAKEKARSEGHDCGGADAD